MRTAEGVPQGLPGEWVCGEREAAEGAARRRRQARLIVRGPR
jgi:hypothetical protein